MANEGQVGSGRLRDLAWSANCSRKQISLIAESHSKIAVTHLVGVDPDEVDLALVFTSDGLDALNESDSVRIIGRDEDVCERDTSLCVESKVLWRDLIEERYGVFGNKGGKSLAGEGLCEVVTTLVESLVHDDGGRGDSGGADGGRVGSDTEHVVIAVRFGVCAEDVFVDGVGLVEVCNENNLVGSLEGDVVVLSDGGNGRERLSVSASQ
jgi:hypothetical protein